jgi:hypothetical protein
VQPAVLRLFYSSLLSSELRDEMADDENLTRKSWARDDQVSVQAKPDFWGWYIQEDLSSMSISTHNVPRLESR